MRFIVRASELSGRVPIPTSKSHTIRALLIGTLADGASRIRRPLESADTRACLEVCRRLGAAIDDGPEWTVQGLGGPPGAPENVLDVGNSGTTLYLALGISALADGWTVFTGDEQIRRRTAQPLLDGLAQLGVGAHSTRGNGCAPLIVHGPLRGGVVRGLEGRSSQYLSSLLLATPMAEEDSQLHLALLNEQPYAEITLRWLADCGIRCEHSDDLLEFHIPGGQSYPAFDRAMPGDFSSATFFLCAAAITGSELLLEGLDMADPQGDKAVVGMLSEMGAEVEMGDDWVRIRGGELCGIDIDLNATPDALPSMAVVGCFAGGTTRLLNVPQARIKETDRIRTMREELEKLGAHVEELEAGLVVHESKLTGATVDGRGDHRLVMALAVAGLAAAGETHIETAESAAVTFPNFADLMQQAGADLAVCG